MPLFSIIIPVYKVENYLHKCVNSVLSQNYKDFEIILVDDGSPDNCPLICDEFAAKDPRIKVIHKLNGGLSEARNFGIKEAKGDYLLFLDSDDYWEGIDALHNLAATILLQSADVTLYGTKDVNLVTNTTVITRGNYNINALRKNKDTAIRSLIETKQFPGSAWVLAIKRDFLLHHSIFFETGIKAEDIDWLLHVFTHAKSIDAIQDPFYMYIKNRPGSITNTSDAKSVRDILFSVSKWRPILESNLTISNRFLLSYLAYQYITSYIIFSTLKEENSDLYELVKKEASILKYSKGLRSTICKILIQIFGIKISGKIFKKIHSLNGRYPIIKAITR